MNKIKTLCIISLVSIALVLLLVSSTALAATEKSSLPKITETRITTSGSVTSPAIYGDKIVWASFSYIGEDTVYDIYMYDLSTKKQTQITTSGEAENPAIYGNRIVWQDERSKWEYLSNHTYDIYMCDISAKKETKITSGEAENPAIYGNRIVWQDIRSGWADVEIYMYDLSTHQETQITSDESLQGDPAIYGENIVWLNLDNNSLYMYDLSTKKESQITTSGGVWGRPAIYGDRIVYTGNRNGNEDIYMYNLSTKKETQITSSPDWQTSPDIYGNRIVWEDIGGDDDGWEHHGIYMGDLSTNKKIKITTSESAGSPKIYGDRIIWQDSRSGDSYIYVGTISNGEPEPIPPVASFSASPTSGNTPLKVQFTDKSTGAPTKWKWSFGDSTYSTQRNPAHTYSKAGKYTVALTASSAAGSNTLKQSSYINVAAPLKAPIAAFSAFIRSGKAPLKVQFTDKSSNNPTSQKWGFGDGTYSTARNPAHTYSKAGKYTVKLTVKNAKGSSTKTVSGYVVVSKK